MTELEAKYKELFVRYHSALVFYASRLVGEDEAVDVVQSVFFELWKNREIVDMGDRIRSFLYKSVHTKCINVLKHRKVRDSYEEAQMLISKLRAEYYSSHFEEVTGRIENLELRRQIIDSIDGLPDRCRSIFVLSYLSGMKNCEIARIMNISLRTVEAQIYKALKKLRKDLRGK